MGESYGHSALAADELMMPYIDACNIACGFHAGIPSIICNTVQSAIKNKVEIGAHPSYPDRDGFGRRFMDITPRDLTAYVLYQIAALKGIIEAYDGQLLHVKPHGALYNRAAKDESVATAIVKAISLISMDLIVYCLPDSCLYHVAIHKGLQVKTEAFIDRAYQEDLSLVSREIKGSVFYNVDEAVGQAKSIWNDQIVTTLLNNDLTLQCQTLCIHSDNPSALSILKALA